MHSEPVELSSRESLSPLPVSELRRACAGECFEVVIVVIKLKPYLVRILEPTRQMPYITAPSRSRLGSVEVDTVSTAVRTCGEQLLSTNYYGVKHSATNTSDRPMSLTKPSFEFDTAMSPLEQILQNQAFKLRKIPTSSDSNILAVQDSSVVDAAMQLPIRSYSRHPSVEGSSLASNFTAAIAAAATHQPHERYAAHISVTRFNGSGRQSAANINPHNSGSSETKTLQLNQMIDHIRCRRNQHRNKFKEAIAYLDQIFEDLKKEGDQVDSMQRSRGIRTESRRKGVSKSGADLMTATVSQSMELQKHNGNTEQSMAANVIGEEKLDAQEVPANRHSLYASKPKITEKHCLQEKASSFERTSDDMDISERDVQPLQSRKLKGERMNFTRRWLTGDVKPWTAVQPKPDLILGGVEEEPEIDERSIGSCSAEVAAINAVVRKKKKARDVPDIIQNVASKAKYARQSNAHQIDRCTRKCGGGGSGHNVQKTDPIKPLPVKAHPTTFNFSTGSTGNLNNFNNLSQSLHYSNAWSSNYDISSNQTSSQRILSQNRISDQVHHGSDADAISWRSPPHHSRYNTLSSPRSDEVQPSMRKTGAFTPVQPPNAITIRGSVASLPDSSTIRPQPLHGVDPFVTIDALVAELELNTDQASIASKRRSFPTGNEFFAHYGGYHEKPNSRKTVNSSQQMEQSNICPSANTKCVDRKQQQKQPQKLNDSFNEMANMLESVISDVTAPNELCKGRKYAQTGMKNKSILSPFETINQEKLNPSKVEAMQSIFENKKYTPVWRRKTSNDSSDNVQSIQSNVNDDDNYYEINDLVVLQKEFIPAPVKQSGKQSASPNSRLKRRLPSVATTAAAVPSRPEFIPAFPVTHPPPHPPAGSTNSSQTGGYYSSGSSLGAQSSYASRNNHLSIPSNSICNRGMVTLTKQPLSSEAANFEEEDDGFYDNIRTDDKRFSRGSELDNVSTVSTTINKPPGPVKTSSRIGQFLRKISASKPPISAASLISLNKFTSEMMPTIPIPLMKSSSLSHCKEKKSVQNINHISSAMIDKRDGLGQRLKNSIFGSKKHL
ncbi:unnamed protein product [Litomosoides sigmodontis]|uniref:Uncharacterized protein n=1 Tax=Litomosoides sigmodontis TaxID=42156 RepID=A0A3P6TEY9_LITSI|nr:unnamed protein product [Litomosoides sigmodontis]